jgi:hypothetical protein
MASCSIFRAAYLKGVERTPASTMRNAKIIIARYFTNCTLLPTPIAQCPRSILKSIKKEDTRNQQDLGCLAGDENENEMAMPNMPSRH